MKKIAAKVKDADQKIKDIDEEWKSLYLSIPNIPHESVLAVEWRAALGIKNTKRTKAKENDIEYVQLKYSLQVVSDDVADAICIGAYYFHKLNNPNDWSD